VVIPTQVLSLSFLPPLPFVWIYNRYGVPFPFQRPSLYRIILFLTIQGGGTLAFGPPRRQKSASGSSAGAPSLRPHIPLPLLSPQRLLHLLRPRLKVDANSPVFPRHSLLRPFSFPSLLLSRPVGVPFFLFRARRSSFSRVALPLDFEYFTSFHPL